MITKVDERGMLSITAETPTESYALKKWFDAFSDDNNETNEGSIQIISFEQQQETEANNNDQSSTT